jgi:hypothetical protein
MNGHLAVWIGETETGVLNSSAGYFRAKAGRDAVPADSQKPRQVGTGGGAAPRYGYSIVDQTVPFTIIHYVYCGQFHLKSQPGKGSI